MKRKVASRKYPFCEKCRSSEGQEGVFPWEVSCFSSKMKDFLRESSWNVEVMHFLLFSPVLLVSTLRFMTAYVTPGQVRARSSEAVISQSSLIYAWRANIFDHTKS